MITLGSLSDKRKKEKLSRLGRTQISFIFSLIRMILYGYVSFYCCLMGLDLTCSMQGTLYNASLFPWPSSL
jgi:hypothetical protein